MDQLDGSANPQVWVFGYGSLCWNPGFEFQDSVTGYIQGYTRRFWQGSANHRGTQEKPGRVATLVDEKEGIVWGRAFHLVGDLALHYLNDRECKLGGYTTLELDFYPTRSLPDLSSASSTSSTSSESSVSSTEPFKTLVFIATPANDHWLGEAPLDDIADQIVACKGISGHNIEYVLRLAHFMHEHIPHAKDNHLFTLEYLLHNKIEAANLCLNEVMGTKTPGDTTLPQPTSYQFSARVPSKKLRCLNI